MDGPTFGARFFELLGYALAVLAVGILCAGVIWSLRLHVREQRRTFYLVSAFAILSTLCGFALILLVLTSPLSPPAPSLQRVQRTDHGPRGDVPADPAEEIHCDLRADGTVRLQGQEFDSESLAQHLKALAQHSKAEYGNKRLLVTLYIEPETPLLEVTRVVENLRQQSDGQYMVEMKEKPQ